MFSRRSMLYCAAALLLCGLFGLHAFADHKGKPHGGGGGGGGGDGGGDVIWDLGADTRVSAINANNEIVGEIHGNLTPAPQREAAYWKLDAAGTLTGPVGLGGLVADANSEARDINDGGWVVGWSSLGPMTGRHAVLWRVDALGNVSGPTSLDGLPGADRSQANAINDNRQVVGWSGVLNPDDGSVSRTGIVWRLDADGNVAGTTAISGELADINDNGQIVGTKAGRATIWQYALGNVTSETDLGVLPGAASSSGEAINSAGEVVGFSGPAGGDIYHAFLWSGGVMTDLGTLSKKGRRGSTPVSYARGINGARQVVGLAGVERLNGGLLDANAFLWEAGEMIDLSKGVSSFNFYEAVDINNAGYIVGLATGGDDTTHGLLLKRN